MTMNNAEWWKGAIWTLVVVTVISVLTYWPGMWVYQRLKAAEATFLYLNTPVTVDIGKGDKNPKVIRAQFIDQALAEAVKQQAAQAAQSDSAPPVK